MPRGRIGWYRLPSSGQLINGTIPVGVDEVVEPPVPGDEPVARGDSGAPIGADVDVELAADPLEIGETPPGAGASGEDDPDVVAQDDQPPTPRKRKPRSTPA